MDLRAYGERFLYACQDANYNVIGLASEAGLLVERYEYTPYGQRTMFSRNWQIVDMNGDGVVDYQDMGILGTDYGEDKPASRADLDGDGDIDWTELGGVGPPRAGLPRAGPPFAPGRRGPGLCSPVRGKHRPRPDRPGGASARVASLGEASGHRATDTRGAPPAHLARLGNPSAAAQDASRPGWAGSASLVVKRDYGGLAAGWTVVNGSAWFPAGPAGSEPFRPVRIGALRRPVQFAAGSDRALDLAERPW